MRRLEDSYHSMLERYVTAQKPIVPFYSSVTGRLHLDDLLGASYWVKNLVSPVLFNSAVQAILAAQLQREVFLEIGPHSALAAPLRQTLTEFESQASYTPTMVRGQDCSKSLLNAVGELHVHSVPVDFSAISPNGSVLTDLPSYSWNHEVDYWSESRITKDWRLRKFAHHEILGARVMESTDLEPSWRNVLNPSDVPWIRDHKLHEDVVFPIAGYVAMIGEAVRQITGANEYMLKDIIVGKAMVVDGSNTVEIVSNFRPVRLTSSLDSDWYDFSVSSHNGSEWIKHCVGQAKGVLQPSPLNEQIEHLQRHVSPSKWYSVMNKVGLNYGRTFQGMRKISASPRQKTAVATVRDSLDISDDLYPLHPAKIDSCLQTFSVAMTQGIPRFLNGLSVPTSIEEIQIRRADSEILAKATILSSQRSRICGDMRAVSEGVTVMSIRGLELSRLEDSTVEGDARQDTIACLTWKPDIDLMGSRLLTPPSRGLNEDLLLAEKLSLLCTIEVSNNFASLGLPPNHLGKYVSWLHRQKDRAEKGEYELVQGAEDYVKLDSSARLSLIEDIRKRIAFTSAAAMGECIVLVFDHFPDVYRGHVDPLDVLMPNGALARLYDSFPADYFEFLGLLSHTKPNLRILEIGAGTGATTRAVLDALTSEFGERMYSEYHYTDVSAGFFVQAKDRFRNAGNIKYNVLDISKDPLIQGFEEASFDLIVASNVCCRLSDQ